MKFIAPVSLFLVLVAAIYGTAEVYPVADQTRDIAQVKSEIASAASRRK